MKDWVARIGQVLAWMIVIATAAALSVAVVVPRVVGATPYTVMTGSMTPHLPPGTLVVVKPVAFDAIGIGDVITYQLDSGEPAVVTHRVIAIGINGHGDRVLTTKGDANPTADAKTVREVQVRGKAWYAVPQLGRVNNLLTGHQRQIAVYLTAAFLIAYAGLMWSSAARDRTRRKNPRTRQVSS